MTLDPKVFKAYDIRGIHPSELDEEGGYAIGRAYVEQFEPRRIAVGRDMRISSPAMAEAVIEGASAGGAQVLDIGLVSTDFGLVGGPCFDPNQALNDGVLEVAPGAITAALFSAESTTGCQGARLAAGEPVTLAAGEMAIAVAHGETPKDLGLTVLKLGR